MNTANLQLEGLLMAIVEVNRLLLAREILSQDDIETAMRRAEAKLVSDERNQELSPANRDAVVFPLRLLRAALETDADEGFADLARRVAGTKQPYNDQR